MLQNTYNIHAKENQKSLTMMRCISENLPYLCHIIAKKSKLSCVKSQLNTLINPNRTMDSANNQLHNMY